MVCYYIDLNVIVLTRSLGYYSGNEVAIICYISCFYLPVSTLLPQYYHIITEL